jgi:hypothetical protein
VNLADAVVELYHCRHCRRLIAKVESSDECELLDAPLCRPVRRRAQGKHRRHQ